MTFFTICVLAVIFSPFLSLAHPLVDERSLIIGATYLISNDPSGNFIISHSIKQDGTLNFRGVTYAGGKGVHGNNAPDPITPDALYTQGSIQVAGENLFAVNAGSNTMSMFAIDPLEPTRLVMIGRPVSTGGGFPVSLAVSSNNQNVCVLNGGKENGVQCFTADPIFGLRTLPNTHRALPLNQTTPPAGPTNTVSHIVFAEEDTKLIAAVKGNPPTPGYLATWNIARDGSLSTNYALTLPASGGLLPFSLTPIPGTNAFLNTDAGIGFGVYDFSKGSDVATSSIYPIEGQIATCWSQYSRKTGTYFLTDVGTSTVTEVAVDRDLNGSIVKQYPIGSDAWTLDNAIASIGSNDFLYVLSAGITTIEVMSLEGRGETKHIQSTNFGPLVQKAGAQVSRDYVQGMAVYLSPFSHLFP